MYKRQQWLSSARARSPELGAAGGHGSNKGLTGRSVQEGTAVEVQRLSGARAMGYSFIGSYQSGCQERCRCVTDVQAALPA